MPVSKKQKRGGAATLDRVTLAERIRRAISEQRFQHGLELARTLWSSSPEPANRQLLLDAAFGRAEQLAATKYYRDAATILTTIEQYLETSEQRERLALLLSRCGEIGKALEIAQTLALPSLTTRLLGLAADAALRGNLQDTRGLPADFQAQHEVVSKAFAELAAGQDDAVRAALQSIGLTSPFLEWKLLLRGFLAYYQNDDARAIENWQRLQAERLPAKMAAPFRSSVDATFRQAQSGEAQTRFLKLLESVQGASLVSRLREVQRLLAGEKQLAQAFRQVEQIIPLLKAENPTAVARLAACCFWAIVDHGLPEDVGRYLRVFGAPPEDPKLARLHALACDSRAFQ